MTRSLRAALLGTLLLVCAARNAPAQEALILSGGGSRGLAHAGAIAGIEELGYDPDMVVGTSMGAVVGALYAAGYAPEEIRSRILAIDWAGMFEATPLVIGPDRADRYPQVTFDLAVEEFRVARGLVAQWRINRALAHLLFDANARARGDFNRLARRYRAVAADLRTGEQVILAEGDLARAARASMSVPGIFAPVVWDGEILIDGGIVDNVPTGVARSLGANRLIVVDVGRPSEELLNQSPLGVIERALDLMQENTQRDTIPPDALVIPDLPPGFGGTSFPADPTALIDLGLAAARRDLPPATGVQGRGERALPLPPDSFAALLVEAPDSALARLARVMMAGAAPGSYDPAAVLRGMDRLYTTGLFEAVWPRVEEDPRTGESVLVVRLDTPPQTSLAAGAGYDNDRGARAWVSLLRQSTLLDRPATIGTSGSINGLERWAAVSARIQTLRRSALAWSVGLHARERGVRFFTDDAVGSLDVVRLGGWAAFELPHILSDQLATATVRTEWVQIEDGPSGLSYGPVLRFSRLNPEALTVGAPFLLEAEHRWGTIAYSTAAIRGSRAYALEPLQLAVSGDLRWSSRDAPADVQPALGDEHAVPGMRWGEERGRVRAVFGAEAAYAILSGHGRLRVRSGAMASELGQLDDSRWVTGAQIAGIWRSPVGIAQVGVGVNTAGGRRLEISIGRSF